MLRRICCAAKRFNTLLISKIISIRSAIAEAIMLNFFVKEKAIGLLIVCVRYRKRAPTFA
jgi:hypothetical protein